MSTLHPNLLCKSLDARNEQSVVWRAPLNSQHTISLRPVSTNANCDIDTIHAWLTDGYPTKLPVDQLRVFFILLGESTYAQAFMILLNDTIPVGTIEVYRMLEEEQNKPLYPTEGDYRIYVPVMPIVASHPVVTVHILQTCIAYFLSFAEVKKLYWVVPKKDTERNEIAEKAGFQWLPSFQDIVPDGDQQANIYQITSDTL